MNNWIRLVFGAAAFFVGTTANAGSTWYLSPTGVTGINSPTAITATATGWANTGAGASVDAQLLQQQTLISYGSTGTPAIPTAWGIKNLDQSTSGSTGDLNEANPPEHALDNNERYEMVLLTFAGSKVSLTSLINDYVCTSSCSHVNSDGTSTTINDSDISVLAYTGSGAPTLAGATWASLKTTGSGWTTIGNFADIGTGSEVISNGTVFSSYWLIGAFNPLSATDPGWTRGNDAIKLTSVTGNVCTTNCGDVRVPEPGTLALFGAGLLGMIGLRRRAHA